MAGGRWPVAGGGGPAGLLYLACSFRGAAAPGGTVLCYGGGGGGGAGIGGGGSGYGPPGTDFQTGVQAGNGRVTVSFAPAPAGPPITSAA